MTGLLIVVLMFFAFVAVLGGIAYLTYQRKLRRAKAIERGLKMVPVLIHLPPPSSDTAGEGRDVREVMREKTAQAEMLYNLLGGTVQDGFKSKFYGQRHVSLEVVAVNGIVHFYAAVPVALVSTVSKAIQTAYPGAQLEEVEDHNIFNQEGRLAATLGGEMVLRQESAYPIATYSELERDPIEALINTITALDKKDGAAVQILIRPATRKWTERSKKIVEGRRKGRASDLTFSAMDLAKAAVKAPEERLAEERARAGNGTGLSNLQISEIDQIEEKTKHPGFEVLIRVVVSTQSVGRSQQLLRDIATTFALFETPGLNGFKFLPALDVQGLVTAFIFRFFPPEIKSNVLNSVELATLFHLPDSQFTPAMSVERQRSKQVDGPVQLATSGLLFGHNEFRGVKKEIRLSNEDRRRHSYILGQTGTGKSTLLENLAVQDMLNGNGFAFIDPHGDTAEKLLAMVPKERAEDVIYFNPSDTDYPLGLNLFEFNEPSQKDFIVQETINMLYKLYDPGKTGIIGPRYEHWYRNAALTLMSDPDGATFIEIPKVFTDTDYLKQKFRYLRDPTVIDFWVKEMGQTSDYHKSEMLGWFVSKFGAFQNNEMMRNIIGQTKSSFSLRDVMDQKKILIVNLSKGKVGELNSQLLGMIFVIKFQAAAMSRADMPEDQRSDFCLYVDEFQNFSTDSFASILSEARKYRLNLIVANQFIGQLSTEIRDAVFGNIGTIIAHRMGPEDAEFMVKQFAPVFDSSDLVNIPNFNAAVRLMIGGLPSQPFTMRDLAPLGTPNLELGLAIKQLSAAKFGHTKSAVESDIAKRLSSNAEPGEPQAAAPEIALADAVAPQSVPVVVEPEAAGVPAAVEPQPAAVASASFTAVAPVATAAVTHGPATAAAAPHHFMAQTPNATLPTAPVPPAAQPVVNQVPLATVGQANIVYPTTYPSANAAGQAAVQSNISSEDPNMEGGFSDMSAPLGAPQLPPQDPSGQMAITPPPIGAPPVDLSVSGIASQPNQPAVLQSSPAPAPAPAPQPMPSPMAPAQLPQPNYQQPVVPYVGAVSAAPGVQPPYPVASQYSMQQPVQAAAPAPAAPPTQYAAPQTPPPPVPMGPPPIGAPPIDLPPYPGGQSLGQLPSAQTQPPSQPIAPSAPMPAPAPAVRPAVSDPSTLTFADITGGQLPPAPPPPSISEVPILEQPAPLAAPVAQYSVMQQPQPAVVVAQPQLGTGQALPNDPYANIDILGDLTQPVTSDPAVMSGGLSTPALASGAARPGDPNAGVPLFESGSEVKAPEISSTPAPQPTMAAPQPIPVQTVVQPAAPQPQSPMPVPVQSPAPQAVTPYSPLSPQAPVAPVYGPPPQVAAPVSVAAAPVPVVAPPLALQSEPVPLPTVVTAPTEIPEVQQQAITEDANEGSAPIDTESLIHFVDPNAEAVLQAPEPTEAQNIEPDEQLMLSGLPAGIHIAPPEVVPSVPREQPTAATSVLQPQVTNEPAEQAQAAAPSVPMSAEPVPIPPAEPLPMPSVTAPPALEHMATMPPPIGAAPVDLPAAAQAVAQKPEPTVAVNNESSSVPVANSSGTPEQPVSTSAAIPKTNEALANALQGSKDAPSPATAPPADVDLSGIKSVAEMLGPDHKPPEPTGEESHAIEPLESTATSAAAPIEEKTSSEPVAENKEELPTKVEPTLAKPSINVAKTEEASSKGPEAPAVVEKSDRSEIHTIEPKEPVEIKPAVSVEAAKPEMQAAPAQHQIEGSVAPVSESAPSADEQIEQAEQEIDSLLSKSLIGPESGTSHHRLPEPVLPLSEEATASIESPPSAPAVTPAAQSSAASAMHDHHGLKIIQPLEPIVPPKERFAQELAAMNKAEQQTASTPGMNGKNTQVSVPAPVKPASLPTKPIIPVPVAPVSAPVAVPQQAKSAPIVGAVIKHEGAPLPVASAVSPQVASVPSSEEELPAAESLAADQVAHARAEEEAAQAMQRPLPETSGSNVVVSTSKPVLPVAPKIEEEPVHAKRKRLGREKPAESIGSADEDAHNRPTEAEQKQGAMTGKLIMPSANKPQSEAQEVKLEKPKKLAPGEVFVDEHGNVVIGE